MSRLSQIVLFLSLMLCGCWGGYSVVDKSDKYDLEKASIKKVIVLPSDFRMSIESEDKDSKIKLEEGGLKNLNSVIKKGLHDARIEYVMINDTSGTTELFQTILPLKNELLNSSILHEDPFDNQTYKTFVQKLFARAPRIDGKFASLSEVYGTPYALYTGVFSSKTKHYEYVIIANLVKGEIIYRNLKYYPFKAKNDNVYTLMYDAIYSLKHK